VGEQGLATENHPGTLALIVVRTATNRAGFAQLRLNGLARVMED
jgi:hypothetical protein